MKSFSIKMNRYSKLDKTPTTVANASCTNRLLTILVVFSTIHTIAFSMLGFAILKAYEDHKDDIEIINNINWGSAAKSVAMSAEALDSNQIKSILKNANNATGAANIAMKNHGNAAFKNIHTFSDKAMERKELFINLERSIIEARRPLKEITDLFDTGARGDLKSSFKLLKMFLVHMNDIPFQSFITLLHEVFERAKKDLNPKNVEEIVLFANKMNNFMSSSESATLTNITRNTNKALMDTDKILNQIFNIDGRK